MDKKHKIGRKTALLTGASGFFGRQFTEALLNTGLKVIAIDQNKNGLESMRKELNGRFGHKLFTYQVDLYNRNQTKELYRKIIKEHKKIDILVNNAFDFSSKTGFNTPEGKIEKATHDQFLACFEAGVYWAFETTQVFGLAMKGNGGGLIVNIGTMYAQFVPNPSLYEGTPQFNPWGYSASKGALLQFTRYAAAWLAPEVRVNMISPGVFPHPPKGTKNPPSSAVLDRLQKKILLRRVGKPEDLVGALLFLISDASSYITGQNFCIDGGITVTVT